MEMYPHDKKNLNVIIFIIIRISVNIIMCIISCQTKQCFKYIYI